MIKHKLKKKNEGQNKDSKAIKSNKNNIFETVKKLYWSGFCLTDNQNFAVFYADKRFLVDNSIKQALVSFSQSENEVEIICDRENRLDYKHRGLHLEFPEIGKVGVKLFNWFTSKYPKASFHRIFQLNGELVNTLIVVLEEMGGRPVGILKARRG